MVLSGQEVSKPSKINVMVLTIEIGSLGCTPAAPNLARGYSQN